MVEISIEKSAVPIVWLDTWVIANMAAFKSTPEKLQSPLREQIEALYSKIRDATRRGKIICPLAAQEMEIHKKREQMLTLINELSLGIQCAGLNAIRSRQIDLAMQAYCQQSSTIQLSYKDAFMKDPVIEIKEILSRPYFIAVTTPEVLFGSAHQNAKKQRILDLLNVQRERNVGRKVPFKEQLKLELSADLEEMTIAVTKYLKGKFKDEQEETNVFFSCLNLTKYMEIWSHYTHKQNDFEGFRSFFSSEYAAQCPYTVLSANLMAKKMIDPQPIRSGDVMDIEHIATLMPFADLFITDKAWSADLNLKKLSKDFSTRVCHISDTAQINEFFEEVGA